jgi:hypothetical protein
MLFWAKIVPFPEAVGNCTVLRLSSFEALWKFLYLFVKFANRSIWPIVQFVTARTVSTWAWLICQCTGISSIKVKVYWSRTPEWQVPTFSIPSGALSSWKWLVLWISGFDSLLVSLEVDMFPDFEILVLYFSLLELDCLFLLR